MKGDMTTARMKGKVCLVTGANSGIGKETCVALAGMQAHVVMVARDAVRGEAARDEVRARSGNPDVELMLADFAYQASVRRLAADFQRIHGRLDVLVNNAGALFTQRSVTVDGVERTFAVNHLSAFLLTNLLLDVLRAGAPSRIVNVASRAHRRGGPLDFDDLQSTRRYVPFRVYGRSKLANILFTQELARRLAGTAVTVNALHPGVVRTGFAQGQNGLTGVFFRLLRPFMLDARQGAETVVYLASSSEVEGITGGYFANKRLVEPHPRARDVASARRLWEVSAALTEKSVAEPPAR